jgi:hypothetical protein
MIHPLTDTCPNCGVSWKALTNCLYDTLDSENMAIGLNIIDNCRVCSQKFSIEVSRIKQIIASAKERRELDVCNKV